MALLMGDKTSPQCTIIKTQKCFYNGQSTGSAPSLTGQKFPVEVQCAGEGGALAPPHIPSHSPKRAGRATFLRNSG